ncbi:helix-turn-helix transcriptional regulator [Pseudomonas aeruginosa]|uniref:helix-turn-helix domain-containing protein n=1 Tax=Pseudomonas aeruginosa TaxID=287 RepID=UPI001EEEF9A7|nr:helix-turn-helix transcriptional regulator [Pseudomonas aeruginosa]MCG7015170.1 helix-turn-helix transcriptional regulator [Pseudomonas aeruginosa]MCG7027850.1 helix-turn-helix transcriptional regulator [Pseudomonas aeruginosa]MCG7057073.1 helix-turn-helix transcriptional regulator [Pseudomonas aeruginosa]MCG7062898.1 helix-turn-helix transcriptional regulator [Pseudomonas aeruginosa]HDP4830713.1 helix-turn-helix transcriptional regulator [Pseudomonas aeruginosa]
MKVLSQRQERQTILPMHIGQIIYALRREKGLTQEALALAAETATSNLSRIEKGQRRPSGALLERLASSLGTSVTSIYASLEGIQEGDASSTSESIQASDLTRDAIQLREGFRELSPENQRLTLEFVRMLRRLQ